MPPLPSVPLPCCNFAPHAPTMHPSNLSLEEVDAASREFGGPAAAREKLGSSVAREKKGATFSRLSGAYTSSCAPASSGHGPGASGCPLPGAYASGGVYSPVSPNLRPWIRSQPLDQAAFSSPNGIHGISNPIGVYAQASLRSPSTMGHQASDPTSW